MYKHLLYMNIWWGNHMTGTQYISEGKRGQENMKFSITAVKTVD